MEEVVSLPYIKKNETAALSMDELKTSTYIDLRGLAFFRIALGTLIFYMLMVRLPELRTFYTDWGTMPRDILLQKYSNPMMWSLYLASGNIIIVSVIYFLHILINFLFILGIRTRVMALLNWVFLISLYERNYLVLHGGDDLIRLMLFIAIFLPLGAKYSIDSFLLNKEDESSNTIHSNLASATFIIQLLCLYFFTGLLKNHPVYNEDGTAIWYTLQLERFTTPIGALLKPLSPAWTFLATKVVFYMECILPFVFLIPWKNNYFRTFVIGVFVFFHLGLSLTMYLDYFPYICIISWLTLLPHDVWDYLESKLKNNSSKSINIYYDKNCNFCKKITKIIQKTLFYPNESVKEIQSEAITTELMEKNHSWVIKSNDKYFTRYAGFHEVLVNSSFNKIKLPGLISKLILKIGLGDLFYKLVSHRRSFFAKFTSKIKGRKSSLKQSVPLKVFMIMVLGMVVYTNVTSIPPEEERKPMPLPLFTFRNTFGLYQRWGLFAPFPTRDDGWITVEANLFDGRKVDIWNDGAPISDAKPESIYKNTKGTLWNKYILNLWDAKNQDKRLYLGRYLCRKWNDSHPEKADQVSTFVIYYFLERTPDPYTNQKEVAEKVQFWSHDCWK